MLLYYRADHQSPITDHVSRRGGRAVDCAGLENRKAERPREFESHPLRHIDVRCSSCNNSMRETTAAHKMPNTAAQTTSDR